MLTYHAAALSGQVEGIIGMTYLDQQISQVREETALTPLFSKIGTPLIHWLAGTPLAALKMPMWLASKMHTLVNDKAALKACLRDGTSAGNWASMRFLSSYLSYRPAIAPESFDICPVLLTQPAEDRWTPLHLSELFLRRITKVPVETRMLDKAGHYPIEEPGLGQLTKAIIDFVHARIGS
jgi:pimeloyl-ACP methyl ester carboxylesterase